MFFFIAAKHKFIYSCGNRSPKFLSVSAGQCSSIQCIQNKQYALLSLCLSCTNAFSWCTWGSAFNAPAEPTVILSYFDVSASISLLTFRAAVTRRVSAFYSRDAWREKQRAGSTCRPLAASLAGLCEKLPVPAFPRGNTENSLSATYSGQAPADPAKLNIYPPVEWIGTHAHNTR